MAWNRLKHMDGNGGFTYSNILPVKLPAARGNGMQVSPNPFNEKITVLFISPQNSLGFISLRNAAGHPVLKQSVTILRGQNRVTIENLGRLPKGICLAQLTLMERNLYPGFYGIDICNQ